MTNLEKCAKYTEIMEDKQKQIEQAKGALKQELVKQKEQLKCKTNKHAKCRLADLKHLLMELQQDLVDNLEQWEKEHGENFD